MNAYKCTVVLFTMACIVACVADEVCYDIVGCFNNSYPFNDVGNDKLPDSPNSIGTVFLLYTRSRDVEPLSYYNETILRRSAFDPKVPTKLIIHGFTQDESVQWMHSMKDALLTEDNFNVVIVGWKNGARAPDYLKAVANTRVVGRQVALLVQLMLNNGATADDVHLIGHSLGAHISGFAGTHLNGSIGRISGLDPAGPSFKNKDVVSRLDPGDAKFVDAIHTNGAPVINGGAGISHAVGHVDFYPNGGRRQPGCPDVVPAGISALFSNGLHGAGKVAACSHDRSVDLYIESISSKKCKFISLGCNGEYDNFLTGACSSCKDVPCSEMGYKASPYAATGAMFLQTGNSPSYCGFPAFVSITSKDTGVIGAVNLFANNFKRNSSAVVLRKSQRIPDSGVKAAVLFPADPKTATDIYLLYSRFGGHFFGIGAGVYSWHLDKLTIADPLGYSRTYCSTSTIASGDIVRLQPCTSSIN